MIRVEQLSKRYDEDSKVIDEVSFSLDERSSMTIIGPSGCGKTTLLYIMAGLTRATSGKAFMDGEEIDRPKKDIAFILQDFGLLPWKTVIENVRLGMKIRGVPRPEQDDRAIDLIRKMGLGQHTDDYPSKLSGGERQRVAIARALAMRPRLLLMDEPFSSLDTLTRERMQDAILEIQRKEGLATITVTHSIEEAVYLGDNILVLGPRPCRVMALIENDRGSGEHLRMDERFFATCKAVRKVVEGR